MSTTMPIEQVMVATAHNRRLALTAGVRAQIALRAGAFIRQRYRMDAAEAERLLEVPVIWRRSRGRSAFYPRGSRSHPEPHIVLRVPAGAFARWNTYQRVRARWATPRGGIELPIDVLMTVVLIHEYTHAVQHGVCGAAPRRFSEVETTENEIEFIRMHAPAAYAQLVAVERAGAATRAIVRDGLRVVDRTVTACLPGQQHRARPAGMHAVALRLLRDIWVRYQVSRGAPGAAAARPAR